MKKFFIFFLSALMIASILVSCNQKTPETGVPSESDTQAAEPALPENLLPPEQVVAALDASATVMEIGTSTRQVLLHETEWAALTEAFLSAGYREAEVTKLSHARLRTMVLYSKDAIVTLQMGDDGAYAIWEPYNASTLSLLMPNEKTGTGEVTLAQLGIARTEETDNPMNGMCYIYKLSDGSAAIIDGGFNTKACRENIMNTLQKLEIDKNDAGEYRITAWILSHGHKDHRAAFTGVGNNFADQIELSYVFYNFPTSPGPLTASTFDLANFEAKMAENFPEAQHVVAHAGLAYHFDNLTVRVLYSPEMLYAPERTIAYYNDTSLIFIADCAGASTLYMGDAGERASKITWSSYEKEAFESDMLQITHHGFNTGDGSHIWRFVKQIYESTGASFGLLPMGSQFEGEERNGRHTVIVGHGDTGWQMSFVVNKKDRHGQGSVSQEYYEQFVASVAAGTNKTPTLFGYDGINKIVSDKGLVTYTSGNESEPMITLFTLSKDGVSVFNNQVLSEWLK